MLQNLRDMHFPTNNKMFLIQALRLRGLVGGLFETENLVPEKSHKLAF